MFYMKRILPFLLFCLTFAVSQAQDIHFSQFYMSPSTLNPALTGVMNGTGRISGNYRNQWASVLKSDAFNTYSVGYDQKIPVGRYDYFGVGGTFWGDRAGEVNFNTMQAHLSGSYSKQMGGYRKRASYLVVGIDAGVGQRSIDQTKARWGSQTDGKGGFDPTKSSNETITRDNIIYPDISAGLLWFSVMDENSNWYVGGAYSHLNRANQSFLKDKNEALYSKFTVHTGGEFLLRDRFAVVPNMVLFFQGPSRQFNLGVSGKFLLGNSRSSSESFQVGTWYRLANTYSSPALLDAAILATRFDYGQFTLGFSYDINLSFTNATRYNGAFEFAMQYRLMGRENRDVYCPNF
jgi:type IX secretion system PorP/SprF family membrane protein